jgi:hypothetical protein
MVPGRHCVSQLTGRFVLARVGRRRMTVVHVGWGRMTSRM